MDSGRRSAALLELGLPELNLPSQAMVQPGLETLQQTDEWRMIDRLHATTQDMVQGYMSYMVTILDNAGTFSGPGVVGFLQAEHEKIARYCHALASDCITLHAMKMGLITGHASPDNLRGFLLSMEVNLHRYQEELTNTHIFFKLNYTLSKKH